MPKKTAPFINKLLSLLSNEKYKNFIQWSELETSIIVLDPANFATSILPKNFKHSNLNSFVRQLNKYNFSKKKLSEKIITQYGDAVWEFENSNFIKNRPDLIKYIVRKRTSSNRPQQKQININYSETSEDEVPNNSEHSAALKDTLMNFANKTKTYFDFLASEIVVLKKLYNEVCTKQVLLEKSLIGKSKNVLLINKIIIAEDTSANSTHAQKSLQYYDYDSIIAENVRDLIELACSGNFTTLIISTNVGNLQEILDKIRCHNKRLAIILSSDVYTNQEALINEYRGINDVIFKPYSAANLNNVLQSISQKFTQFCIKDASSRFTEYNFDNKSFQKNPQ